MFKKDLFWSVRADKLPDVSDPGLEEAERYKMVSEPTLEISRVRVGQGCGHGVQAFCGSVRGHLGCTVVKRPLIREDLNVIQTSVPGG